MFTDINSFFGNIVNILPAHIKKTWFLCMSVL